MIITTLMRRFAALFAVLLLLILALSGVAVERGVQNEAPPLVLKDLTGHERNLAYYREQIVVLNFWATWCVPCRDEMPLLSSIHTRYTQRGVQVIGASTDDEKTQKEISKFINKVKIKFPIWVGAGTADMQRFGLGEALPATAIIDRDGRIISRILGPVKKGELEARIDWLLGDRSTPAPAAQINNLPKHDHDEPGHEHGEEEEHEHGGVGVEGASTVPS